MAKTYIQPGDVITLTAPYARNPGEGALVGNLFGVALATTANAAAGDFAITGVWTLAKSAGVNWLQGAVLYWDNAAKSVTNVTTSNTRIGSAMQAQVNGDATCIVRLSGNPAPTGA